MRCAAVNMLPSIGTKEIAVAANDYGGTAAQDEPNRAERLGRIGVDWWATIVAGVLVLLAVAGLLPKIPW